MRTNAQLLDLAYDLLDIVGYCYTIFPSTESAAKWLATQNNKLDNRIPLELKLRRQNDIT